MTTEQLQERRDLICGELSRAVDVSEHIGRLKQSEWYQARKEEVRSIDDAITEQEGYFERPDDVELTSEMLEGIE